MPVNGTMRRKVLIAIAFAASLAGGCATALNLQDESLRKPYGGFTMSVADFFGGGDFGEASSILYWPMWLIDKPFSLLGDTVALPYTLWTLNHSSGSAQTKPIPPANDRLVPP